MKSLFILLTSSFLWCFTLNGQDPTIGVVQHSGEEIEGYTLLAPNGSTSVYLIDVCGRVVHSWQTGIRPALRTQLTPEGMLIRTTRRNGIFAGGGVGGEIRAVDWEGDEKWRFEYSDQTVQLHHDFDLLPNGNIVAIAWEALSREDAIAMGRNPNTLSDRGMWPDHIIEYNPRLDSIVWKWHFLDHLIQDFDSNQSNFGVVSDHPELLDINLINPVNGDWNHLNAIFYNEEFDQIIISSRTMNEVYVIDHSTTTEEASGHTGGRYGKGGDLLYRWGNPANYKRGEIADKRLFGQHDVRFILEGSNKGKIMVYNNGTQRPGGVYSSIEVIDPPMDENGNYSIEADQPYLPLEANTIISGRDNQAVPFHSDRISGAFPMDDDHVLVCVGMDGIFYEFNGNAELVWEYRNPLNGSIPQDQGSMPNQVEIFKTQRYPLDYPAFEDKNLEPGLPIELNPTINDCVLSVSSEDVIKHDHWEIYPNPTNGQVKLDSDNSGSLNIYDIYGRKLRQIEVKSGKNNISIDNFSSGIYFFSFENEVKKLFVRN